MSHPGRVHLRFMRYIDWVTFLTHQGRLDNLFARLGWEEDVFIDYEYDLREIKRDGHVVAIDTGSTFWVEYFAIDGAERALGELEDFSHSEIRPHGFLCEQGTPGRALEALDWAPFYGWVEPEKGDPVAFTAAADHPRFLTVPATPDGNPARTRTNAEAHETFLRARQIVEELMADADRHLRFEGPCLPGPSAEEHESDRRWEWFEDTEEEQRRRAASDLGTRRAPSPRADRHDTLVESELVSAIVYSQASHDAEGRKIDRKADADAEFQSVFQLHLQQRRRLTPPAR